MTDEYGEYYSELIRKAEGVLLDEFRIGVDGEIYYFDETLIYAALLSTTAEERKEYEDLSKEISRLWGGDRGEFRAAVITFVKYFLALSRKHITERRELFNKSIADFETVRDRQIDEKVAEDKRRRQEARGII